MYIYRERERDRDTEREREREKKKKESNAGESFFLSSLSFSRLGIILRYTSNRRLQATVSSCLTPASTMAEVRSEATLNRAAQITCRYLRFFQIPASPSNASVLEGVLGLDRFGGPNGTQAKDDADSLSGLACPQARYACDCARSADTRSCAVLPTTAAELSHRPYHLEGTSS